MNTIELTEIEMEMAFTVAKARRLESIMNNRKNRHQYDPDDIWQDEFNGAAAELAYCKYRGEYWGGTVGSFKEADVAKSVQIRHTILMNGCLIVRPDDNQEHYYVLVTGGPRQFRIVGWIQGKDAINEKWKKSPNKRPPAYFVPQRALRRFKG